MKLEDRNQLIIDHLDRLNIVVRRMSRGCPPHLYDDFESIGQLAMIEAAEKYDSSKGKFWTYAEHIICGRIRDEMRKTHILSKVPRGLQKSKELYGVVSYEELIERRRRYGAGGRIFRQFICGENSEFPLFINEQKGVIWSRMDRLPQVERIVMYLYFWKEWTQAEIAELLKVSPSRISQLQSEALKRMRRGLSKELYGIAA